MKMMSSRAGSGVLRSAVAAWIADDAPSRGAALAFHAVLALAPVLLVAAGLAGYFIDREAALDGFLARVSALLGEAAAAGIDRVLEASGARQSGVGPAFAGLVIMFVAIAMGLAELRSALDRAWRTHLATPACLELLRYLAGLALASALGATLVASLLATYGAAVPGAPLGGRSPAGMLLLDLAGAFAITSITLAFIFRVLPAAQVRWSSAFTGAAFAALAMVVGTLAAGCAIARNTLDAPAASAAAVLLVIVWVYWTAQALVLGAYVARAAVGGAAPARTQRRRLSDMNASYEALRNRVRPQLH